MRRRDDLMVGPKEKAIEAVKAGKRDEAIRYIQELYQEFKPLHDRYGDWIQTLLNFIADKLGEGAVEKALEKTFHDVYKERLILSKNLTPEEMAKSWAQSHRTHFSDFSIEEDDEKIVINIPYCGSGGRIQKETKAEGKTKKAYPWSFGEPGVCYYCCHETIFTKFSKDLGLDWRRYECNKQFDDEGKPTGKPCRWIIYKEKPKA